jgi:outer membrane protein TolC
VLGASLRWNIFDWSKTSREREIIALRKQIVASGKSDTEQNIQRQLDTKLAEIESLRTLVKTGEELVTIRERISLVAQSKLDNGTMTASEYMAEINPGQEAAINLEMHRVNLLKAEAEYNYLKGTENK